MVAAARRQLDRYCTAALSGATPEKALIEPENPYGMNPKRVYVYAEKALS